MSSVVKNRKRSVLLLALAAAALLMAAAAAQATAAPVLRLSTMANTNVAPGAEQRYYLEIVNVGDMATSGPWQLHVELPAELSAVSLERGGLDCAAAIAADPRSFTCASETTIWGGTVAQQLPILTVTAAPGGAAGIATAHITFFGGGAVLPDGGPCAGAYPGTPCAATADPSQITTAPPVFGIDAFDAGAIADELGTPYLRAGGHPYATATEFEFPLGPSMHPEIEPIGYPAEEVKDTVVELPPGLAGVLSGLPQCETEDLATPTSPPVCDPASQVGTAVVRTSWFGELQNFFGPVPVFNMVPPPDAPARFGFSFSSTVITFTPRLGAYPDYTLAIDAVNITESLAVNGVRIEVWGTPADPAHDRRRACPGKPAPEYVFFGPSVSHPDIFGQPPCTDKYTRPPETAFLRMPTSCEGPLEFKLHADSWQHPATRRADGSPNLSDPGWHSAPSLSHEAPGYPYPRELWGPPTAMEGCEDVPFDPSIAIGPTTPAADSPSGLDVELAIPQGGLTDPEQIAQSDLKDISVKLPEGFTVNPSSADGLGACAPNQIELESTGAAECPDDSKIGSVRIETPALSEALEGSVYLAAQNDNPFDSLLALYVVARGSGVTVKLPGKVEADPATGQITTSFTSQPQFPFERLELHLKSGPRAPLRTPQTCGTHTTTATLTPWSGNAPVQLQSSFQITSGPQGGPCPSNGFDPKLTAGTERPIGGAFSPFLLRLTRDDGSEELASVSAELPPGLLAKLAGVPYCPDSALASISGGQGTGASQLASPSCPSASQVGSVTVGAGAGSNPFYLSTGKVYLAGPYRGAPLSLAIATPAVAGPFDLGTVLVRTALRVDPESARITAVSDPLPTILHGISLDLRDVRVAIDRPSFALNPTSCDPMAIEAQISGTRGSSATRTEPFQVANCGDLLFRPKLRFALRGKGKRGGHPAFRATLTAKAGEANVAKASVTLPKSVILDQGHIKTICTRVQFAADSCPPGSIYGYARAKSPLLDAPLQGPVYLRSNGGERNLPDLVAALDGQIQVNLVGFIDAVRGKIRNRFEAVPDAPVSEFTLTMKGGRKGLLVNTRNICRGAGRAAVLMDGQNGKTHDTRPALKAQCKKKRKAKRGRKGRR